MEKFDTLVISGGAFRGYLSLGALSCLEEHGYLNGDIETYAGTSIGAVICTMLILGFTPLEIFVATCDDEVLPNIRDFDLSRLMKTFGVIELDSFFSALEDKIVSKLGAVPTFADLYRVIPKRLVICAYNLTAKELCYFDHETAPQMKIIDAMRLSCSIPFLFSKQEYNGDVYVDGGIVDDFPVNYLDNGNRKILGIYTPSVDRLKYSNEVGFFDFLYDVTHAPIKEIRLLRDRYLTDSVRIMKLYTHLNTSMWDKSTRSEKFALFSDGYRDASKFITGKNE